MSARDEAIEAGANALGRHRFEDDSYPGAGKWCSCGASVYWVGEQYAPDRRAHQVRAVLDAARASGAFVWRDELEQVGCRTIRTADLEKWYVSTGPVWRYEQAMIDGDSPEFIVERLYRKRPQEPNE